MTEFVGRTGALRVYSYPETPRAVSPLAAFARNFATGPKEITIGSGGIQIPWNSIDVPPPSGNVDVPITPRATGVVLISGVVTVQNSSGISADVVVTIQVNGVALPPATFFGIAPLPDGETVTIPFLAETSPTDTPVGVTSNIEIFVVGLNVTLATDDSAVSVQEVSVATG